MTRFADDLSAELSVLVRARVPMHGIRLTVRERIVERLGRGPLGAREVSESVEAAVRAACRLAASSDAADDLVETVCRAALEAVRGQGGYSARWLTDAMNAAEAVLDEVAQEHDHERLGRGSGAGWNRGSARHRGRNEGAWVSPRH